jgi:hypothetical protein
VLDQNNVFSEDKELGLRDDDPLFQDINRRLHQMKWEGKGGIWDSMRPPITPAGSSQSSSDSTASSATAAPVATIGAIEPDEDLPLAALLPSPVAPATPAVVNVAFVYFSITSVVMSTFRK